MSAPAPIKRDATLSQFAQPFTPREAAVVDVGSNSVRLVTYRIEGRALTPFLNEKVMAGLGRGLAQTGRLSPEGAKEALSALRRFRTLLDGLGVRSVQAVATAAVRDAEDAPEFLERVRQEAGLPLRVISGPEEARLSALGVMAGAADAVGVVGDLGGSSLELVRLSPEGPQGGESFPLGPLALMRSGADLESASARIEIALALSEPLAGAPGGAFYAVGGAWRALGRIDIALRSHPLEVLHHHEIARSDVLRLTEFVRKASRKQLERFGDAAAKRAETLPLAALVLERILRVGGFEQVVLSSYGLREGLLFDALPLEARSQDPLVAGAAAFGAAAPRARAFGAALCAWIAEAVETAPPAFGLERDRILRQAACLMADVGGVLHPEQRRETIFDLVLRAPFAGVSHAERVYLATMLHHRYSKTPPDAGLHPSLGLLHPGQRSVAAAVGAGLRLGADLSGRCASLLQDFRLEVDGPVVKLSGSPTRAHLITEMVNRRLEAFSEALAAACASA